MLRTYRESSLRSNLRYGLSRFCVLCSRSCRGHKHRQHEDIELFPTSAVLPSPDDPSSASSLLISRIQNNQDTNCISLPSSLFRISSDQGSGDTAVDHAPARGSNMFRGRVQSAETDFRTRCYRADSPAGGGTGLRRIGEASSCTYSSPVYTHIQ